MDKLVIGIDFGSDSVRGIVVNTRNGAILGSKTAAYPRWKKGLFCEPKADVFRQHPLDYLESLENCIKGAIADCQNDIRGQVSALAIDSTGSTPCPVDRKGVPLALLPGFEENPNAMFHLWKDHSAKEEAKEITDALSKSTIDYTKFQGIYSAEWYWAKILHTIRIDEKIREKAYSWVEHCDWITGILCGNTDPNTMYRSSCGAGHKALWHSEFGGLPNKEVLYDIDPYLKKAALSYGDNVHPATAKAGRLVKAWAAKWGLSENTVIAGCSFDAHAGAVGAGIKKGTLVKVLGTSTVDMMIEEKDVLEGRRLQTVCGQAEDSIVPGFVGIEAGQAAFGDVYSWYAQLILQPVLQIIRAAENLHNKETLEQLFQDNLLSVLIKNMEQTEIDEGVIALDWLNGRRYPKLNENLRGALKGFGLSTNSGQLYRAFVLATLFGSKRIFDELVENGLEIQEVIAVGGIPRKAPEIMQMLADVLNKKISVLQSDQACAKGSAMYAAVAGGIFDSLQKAQEMMCDGFEAIYFPNKAKHQKYQEQYGQYMIFGNYIERETEELYGKKYD